MLQSEKKKKKSMASREKAKWQVLQTEKKKKKSMASREKAEWGGVV